MTCGIPRTDFDEHENELTADLLLQDGLVVVVMVTGTNESGKQYLDQSE
jgi:hypothetical protein